MKALRTLQARAVMALFAIVVALIAGAHQVNDLFIRVVINDLGHARVVEVRDCTIGYGGTEAYIKQYNLHGMRVGELSVSDETGTVYETMSPWDVDLSRAAKTNRCGIARVSEGYELCWGIGASGHRVYNVHYTLAGLVNTFDDSDGFIFNFYEAASGAYAQHARVVIEAEGKALSAANTRVWAFHYYGTVNFVDGKIVAETQIPFNEQGKGIVVMAQFAKGVFHPVMSRGGSFVNKVIKPAFKGSDYDLSNLDNGGLASLSGYGYSTERPSAWAEIWEGISGLLQMGLWVILIGYLLYQFYAVGYDINRARHNLRLFGNKQGEMTQWSRDIPFGGDLYRTSQVIRAVEDDDVPRDHQIAAVIMRLTHTGHLILRTGMDANGQMVGEFLVTPPLQSGNSKCDELLYAIHNLMWQASGDDHVLQPNELEQYMREYPVEHRRIVKQITRLLKAGGVSLSKLSPARVREVYGLKKYLEEFTLLNERHVPEVMLWKEYMVFASLFGIADKVYKELTRVWPDYVMYAPDDDMLFRTELCDRFAMRTLAGMSFVSEYETPAERAAREARERDSGGGGSSSYGGGGGYSGGGGSGFR